MMWLPNTLPQMTKPGTGHAPLFGRATTNKDVRRRPERGALREFAQVEARVAHEEIEAGLARHASCPPLLKAWLAHDAVRQSAPGDDC